MLPALPEAPAKPDTALASFQAAVPEGPAAEAPATEAPPAEVVPVAPSGSYLVSVGLFSSQERADQLVDTLTKAGLPAMQRPFLLRSREVQQIVLGPFFTRADAVADLRRLYALGGYADATVIDTTREPASQ